MLFCGTALESYQHYRQRHGTKFENGPLENWVLSFGLYTNTSKLMNTDIPKKADHLGCIDGIRFLSMSWVVLCHCWGEGTSLPMRDTNLGLLKVIYFFKKSSKNCKLKNISIFFSRLLVIHF